MIEHTPHEVLFALGPIRIFTWGFFVALAFVVSYYFIIRQAKKEGYNIDSVYDILLYLAAGAILGSRLFSVLSEPGYYLSKPWMILAVWQGGMTSYGGIFGGVLAVYIACRKHKVRFLKFADLMAPYVALGLAIGRIGCLLRFCCFGVESALPWAVNIGEGFARHPTQAYELFFNLLIMFIILKAKAGSWFKKHEGTPFALFLVLYSAFRLFTDTFREYEPPSGLYTSRIILIILFMLGSAFLVYKANRRDRR